jgi:hypothetical protein
MATMSIKTTFIHPITRKLVSITGVDTLRGSYSGTTQESKLHPEISFTATFDTEGVDAYHHRFFYDLQRRYEMYEGYIPIDEYVDWPLDTEVPEYDANYRIFATYERSAFISANAQLRPLLAEIRQDYTVPVYGGHYLYLDQFRQGDAFVVRDILGLVIESNPHKPVPPIDYTPPEGFVFPSNEPEKE